MTTRRARTGGGRGGRAARFAVAGVVVLLLAALVGAPRGRRWAAAALVGPDSVSELLRGRLTSGRAAAAGDLLLSFADVRRFYEAREYAPAWTRADAPPPAAAELMRRVARAPADGLLPAAYHSAALERLLPAAPARTGAATRADLELLLTDAFLTYGQDLLAGRVDPRTLHRGWTLTPRRRDLPALLREALAANAVAPALDSLAPSTADYVRLRAALRRYRGIALAGGWAPLPAGRVLRLGDTGDVVRALRRRVDLELGVPGEPTDRFDAPLDAAVRSFQLDHGLEGDGVVGGETRLALNVPVEDRVAQLERSMERLRWLPESLGARYVEVDIPAFELAVVEGGVPVLGMRVVGGRADWPTPVFSARMNAVVLAPYWNVPPSIAALEVLPRARRDPGYLARQHMVRLSGGRIRQEPGPWNALGGMKFVFPNPYNVYLHDTPERQLFARPLRAFSHGCIRIEKPMELALYVLGADTAWTAERVRAGIDAGVERTVPLAAEIPVHVLYRTAWVDSAGAVQFRDDLYGHDARLAAVLAGRTPQALLAEAGGCGAAAP